MKDKSDMIRPEEAIRRILDIISPLPLERVGILQTLGRVLGEDIFAGRDIPPKNNSSMDGYALRSSDTKGASWKKPVVLRVLEDIPAGSIPRCTITPGTAARIMTGAPLPEGADAVLRMEDTEKNGGSVRIFVEVEKDHDVRFAGEDVRNGELILPRGCVVRPPEVGMLASLGRAFVSVYQRPIVAILATGDELVDIDEPVSPWKIVSSNSYSLAAEVLQCGGIPLQIGIARDNREDLVAKFRAALRADLIVSSGGVSVGDYDLVKDVMKDVGNRMDFWRVAMRPGRPLAFGIIEGVPVFGLPGNPVSSMVSFEQFVRPTILKLAGKTKIHRRIAKAILQEDVPKKEGLKYFIRGIVNRKDGGLVASTTGEQGSGILKSMVRANALIVLPEGIAIARAGDEVRVQILDDSLDLTDVPGYE
ncbi:MAG: Molybdopterin molybdenumtransferase [Syntrophaceae bacterium PtaU1.Bin231]|nr:MAG: Molybdopterin molybdenumtransferase [Syntrophaceae bacterium PtaU1.Bin231]